MQYDRNAMFSEEQAITATTASEKKIETVKNIAAGTPVLFGIEVVEDFNNLTSLGVKIQTAETEALLSSAPVTLYDETFLAADLVKGILKTGFVPNKTQRFTRMYYTVNGTAPTTGKIKAGIVDAVSASYEDMQIGTESGQTLNLGS